MDRTHQRVSLNFISILFGRGFGLLLNFLSIALAARYLGVENYGLFTSVVALVIILSKLIDFGFGQIVFRETSKTQSDFSFINNALTFRIVLFFLIVIFYNILSFIINVNSLEIILSNILFLNVIISARFLNFRDLLEVTFKVRLKMHLVMIANITDNFLLLFLVLIMPYVKGGIIYFAVVYCLANIPGFIIMLIYLYKRFNYKFEIVWKHSKWLVQESIPLFGYVIFITIFQQFDILLLKNLDSKSAAGIYAAGLRLTMPLSVIPIALTTTILPIIIKELTRNKEKVSEIINSAYKLLFIFSFAFAAIISFKAEEIILLFFGPNYVDSSSVILIVVWSYLFLFYNFFSLDLLTVFEQQKFNFLYSVFIVVINISLVLLLIQDYSFIGVAWARTIATVLGAIFIKLIYIKLKHDFQFVNLRLIIWSFISILFIYLISSVNLLIYFILVPLIMLVITITVKVFNYQETIIILKLLRLEKYSKYFS